ncbi:MAG: aminoglycoside phosphotransferase family protein [Clostridia bacterium]|nr:aminoglycoside phosphotransferase family protein [Clostridia bacterium]
MVNVNKILEKYGMNCPAEEYGDGHINDTYLIEYNGEKYILQRINHNIFKNPHEVMENILGVTKHISDKLVSKGEDPKRRTLTVINTLDNKPCCEVDGNYFRMYNFISDTVTYQTVERPVLFYKAAKGFGEFFNLLSDYDASKLHESIPDFHNTQKRFCDFENSVKTNKSGRAELVEKEIQFLMDRKHEVSRIMDEIKKGTVPLRVTHNDTKLNNILFDKITDDALCVIDLDTVMPGSVLFDYGDALRFGTNPVAEDEKDLSKVYCDIEKFEQFTKGFIESLGNILTEKEIELLPFSAQLLTLECGMRFLADYIDGDIYFKTHYEEQNLDRARTQLKLVYDMELKEEEMVKIIKKYI